MKNCNRTPDNHNKWRWDKTKKKWTMIGKPQLKLYNGKVIFQSEWDKKIRDRLGEI